MRLYYSVRSDAKHERFSKRQGADSSNPQPFPFKKLKELCSANIGIISGTQWVFFEISIHSLKYAIAFSGSESMW